MLTPKKQAPVKPTGVLRKATEDPNYVALQKKLGKMGNGGPVKPTGVTRKATEDPNYVALQKKLGKMRKGGVKGKKVEEKATKETYKSKAAMMKHEKGESKKMKMKEGEIPAFMKKAKKPVMRKGGMKGKKAC